MSKSHKELSEYWEEKVNEYKKSEIKISQSKWCKENNLILRRFNYWYCKFKKNEKENNITGSNCEKNDKENKTNVSNCSQKAKENKANNSNCSKKYADVNNQTKWIPIKVEDTELFAVSDTCLIKDTGPIENKSISVYENNNKAGITINIGKAKIEMMMGFDTQSLLEVLKVVNLLC